MSLLEDSENDYQERFFRNASHSATPQGIAKNWFLILRMLTVLAGSSLWHSLKCCASIPKALTPFLFNRRVRQQVHLYQEAKQAGSADANQKLEELVSAVKAALDVEPPTA